MTIIRQSIQSVFEQQPASFVFQEAAPDKPPKVVGGSQGAAMEIAGPSDDVQQIVLAVVLPPDNEDMARRGGLLLSLLIASVTPRWMDGIAWMTAGLRASAASFRLKQEHAIVHSGLRYILATDKGRSLATLRITRHK
jgi:hypothetical protein